MELLKAHEEAVKQRLKETKDSLQLIRKKISFYEEALALHCVTSKRA